MRPCNLEHGTSSGEADWVKGSRIAPNHLRGGQGLLFALKMSKQHQPPAGVEYVAIERFELRLVHTRPTDRLSFLSNSLGRLDQVEMPRFDGHPLTKRLTALFHRWEPSGAGFLQAGDICLHGVGQLPRLTALRFEVLGKPQDAAHFLARDKPSHRLPILPG